eukprot:m.34641 g.34641  ORF g.34641 m.34641 type:complete len:429 (-) comp12329_c0_seq1:238-1524(-)
MAKELFQCDFPGCNKTFTLKRNMLRHVKLHTEAKKHACDFPGCNRRFHRASDLRSHLLTHDPARKFPCTHPGCSASYTRRTDLQTHMRKVHRQLTCDVQGCTKGFKSRTQLQSHLRQAHDEDPADPPFQVEQSIPKPKRRRAKRSAKDRQPVRFPRPAKAAAPNVHPRPLHQLLPASLKEAFDPTPPPALVSAMDDEVTMLDCMLDFDTDWSLILGPPQSKRVKLHDSDFDDSASWQTRSDAGCTSDLSDELGEPSWLTPQLPLTSTMFKPSQESSLPSSTFNLSFDSIPTSAQQPPHDFGRCSPLCDTHASKVLLSLHAPKQTDLSASQPAYSHPHPHTHADEHEHTQHGVGCGHPIVKHNDHHDFLLPNGQVQCEAMGAVNINDLLDDIVFEGVNGAEWDIQQALDDIGPVKLQLPPKGTAFSPLA